jgi:hypothetical protein
MNDTYQNIYDDYDFNPNDATVIFNTSSAPIAETLNTDAVLTTGKWLFVFDGIKNIKTITEPIKDSVIVDGYGTKKQYDIVSISYDVEHNECSVLVDIKENPIPLLIIYPVIYAAILIIGAIAINSVLKSVTQVIEKPIDALNSPVGWAIILIIAGLFLLPALGLSLAKK